MANQLPIETFDDIFHFIDYFACRRFILFNSRLNHLIHNQPQFLARKRLLRLCIEKTKLQVQEDKKKLEALYRNASADLVVLGLIFWNDSPPSSITNAFNLADQTLADVQELIWVKKLQLDGIKLSFFYSDFSVIESNAYVKSLHEKILIVTKTKDEDWPQRTEEIMRFGYPSMVNLHNFEDFVISFNSQTLNANWVMEHLTPLRIIEDPNVNRTKSAFRTYSGLAQDAQVKNVDYEKSGYHRGHLAAAGNYNRSQQSTDQSFFLLNMTPQKPKFNTGKWKKLESHVRTVAKCFTNTYVCSGPLYLHANGIDDPSLKTIGPSKIAVPTHFFKAVLFETIGGLFELETYLMTNNDLAGDKDLSGYFHPLDSLQNLSGLSLFDKLPKEKVTKVNGKN